MISLNNCKDTIPDRSIFTFLPKKETPSLYDELWRVEQDYIDLFSGNKKGHMAKYVHMYRPHIYEEILKQEAYYPFKMESDLLIQVSEEICTNFKNVRYVLELGPGSHTPIISKTVPFLRALKKQVDLFTYMAIDSTLEYAEDACRIIEKHFTGIKTQPLEIDFLSQKAFEKIEKDIHLNNKKLIVGFGQPIFANNNDSDIEMLIKNIGSFLNKKDFFVFGIDTNNEQDTIEAAYNTKVSHELLLNVMHYLKISLNLESFNPEAFNIIYNWNDKERAVALSLKATKRQSIKIRGQEFVINKNQELNILNSKKPPIEKIKDFLKKGSLIIKEIISIDNNKDNKFSIVLAQKDSRLNSP